VHVKHVSAAIFNLIVLCLCDMGTFFTSDNEDDTIIVLYNLIIFVGNWYL